MLEISQKLLCFLFLASFAAGIALGGIYDLLTLSRLFLGLSPKRNTRVDVLRPQGKFRTALTPILLFLEDLCFILLCGISLLLLLYFVNDGVFRFWAPLGMGCGFFVYRMTLGRLITRISEALVKLLHRFLRRLISCLLFPLRLILHMCFKCFLSPLIRWLAKKSLARRITKTNKEILKFRQSAGHLFGMETQERKE